MKSRTIQFVTKYVLNTNTHFTNYDKSELTAIRKMKKIPLVGFVDDKRICNPMGRISVGVNSARS